MCNFGVTWAGCTVGMSISAGGAAEAAGGAAVAVSGSAASGGGAAAGPVAGTIGMAADTAAAADCSALPKSSCRQTALTGHMHVIGSTACDLCIMACMLDLPGMLTRDANRTECQCVEHIN